MEGIRNAWQDFVFHEGPTHLLHGVAIVAACFALALALRFSVRRLVARLERRALPEKRGRYQLVLAAQKPLGNALVVFGVYLGSAQLPIVAEAHDVINGILYVLGAYLVARGVSGIVRAGIDAYAERVRARHDAELRDVAVLSLLRTLGSLLVWLLGLIVVLKHFEQDIFSLVTALGVGSLAIGLAARDTLGNMISGFVILLDRPFREGDRIQLASGEIGDVREIGLRSTKIQLFDETILVVPNSELVNLRIINQAYPTRRIRGNVLIGVEYGVDMDRAKAALLEVARAHPEVLPDPPPSVDLTAFGAHSLDLRLSYFVSDYLRMLPVAEMLRVACYRKLAEVGIAIPFPTRTLYVKGADGGDRPALRA